MSGTRRRHGGPRRDRGRPDPRKIPKRPPYPAARCTGGPLDKLTVHIERVYADAGWWPVPGGRYVRVDADEWAYERDHMPASTR